jgi:hypothetical protein
VPTLLNAIAKPANAIVANQVVLPFFMRVLPIIPRIEVALRTLGERG